MKHVVCLYEHSGLSARPWAEAGYNVFCYDILHTEIRCEAVGSGAMTYAPWDARDEFENERIVLRHHNKTAITLCFPPCTDLAVSGAAHFGSKRQKDQDFQKKAMDLVYTARDMAEAIGAPYVIENPISVISSMWRKPDHSFHPYEYGGYLPEDDVHPLYPDYYPPHDSYGKKTCYWAGKGFLMPQKKPVPILQGQDDGQGQSKAHNKLGGKSAKTKAIRSCSPRGMAQAIFMFNSGLFPHLGIDNEPTLF